MRAHFEIVHADRLPRYLDFVLAREDTPDQTEPRPVPRRARPHRARPEQCVVVEDTERGLAAARRGHRLHRGAEPSRGRGDFSASHKIAQSVRRGRRGDRAALVGGVTRNLDAFRPPFAMDLLRPPPEIESTRTASPRTASARRAWRHRASDGQARLGVFIAALLLAWRVLARGALALLDRRTARRLRGARRGGHARVIPERKLAERAAASTNAASPASRIAVSGSARPAALLDPGASLRLRPRLFGHGSLFQLLCTARTRAGE